ncbi:Phosphoglucan, water dikinase, chloroplastic-like protein [Quillaja saponaria]|uniref:Phosphoglucan, water dikinase, chloroplastic-like protein n=1 Tax=Quillaja saponaria TaxID=32244 RepID=A0AAD7PMQ5_QUISA|nr:Phosphoglucan, water dikinase, chloroplastic-like protein [Quillaja saponaria]
METLTGSFSKVIIDNCRDRGRDFIHHRPKFLPPLRPQNDKLVNYRFLQLVSVYHKGIHPINSLSSETQADLDTAETEPQQTHESNTVHVKLKLQKECMFGEQFNVVGDDPMFGLWDPSDAIPMTWSDEHIWTVELDIPVGKTIKFKFILKGKGGEIMWQPGSDRIFQTWETNNTISVCEDWDNAELQKLIEEDTCAHQNEKPEINSEVSIVAENLTHPKEEMVSSLNTGSDIEGVCEDWDNAELQKVTEEDPCAHQNEKPGINSEMSIVAENLTHPKEEMVSIKTGSDIEGSKTYLAEKPFTEPQMGQTAPTMIFAEDIRLTDPKVESTDTESKDPLVAENLGNNSKAAAVKNPEGTVIDSNLLNYEGVPILVPGLASSVISTEEESRHDIEERTVVDTSVGVFEATDYNKPEVLHLANITMSCKNYLPLDHSHMMHTYSKLYITVRQTV